MEITNSNLNVDQHVITLWLQQQIAEKLEVKPEEIRPDRKLTSFGLDSMDSVMISGDLEEWLDVEVPSTLLWDYPTIYEVSAKLISMVQKGKNEQEVEND